MKMLNRNSFWWGLGVGIFISFIASYLVWPRIPVDTEFRDGTKVILPASSDPVGIYYPLDGAKMTGKFLVYGVGNGLENKGEIVIEDQQGQITASHAVEFLADEGGLNGVFMVLVDAGVLEESQQAGLIRLYGYTDGSGNKRELSKTHVRFK